jgi:hypothetical protein
VLLALVVAVVAVIPLVVLVVLVVEVLDQAPTTTQAQGRRTLVAVAGVAQAAVLLALAVPVL